MLIFLINIGQFYNNIKQKGDKFLKKKAGNSLFFRLQQYKAIFTIVGF
jgi:hypothetical protein